MTKTPLTIITGSLGSGKTTLLKHILDNFPHKIAILMNEFGEIGIDGKIIKGKNVNITELDGGCVCCSLVGEFEAAIKEIVDSVEPEYIVVETTGIAEPDAMIVDVEENLPEVRLDGMVTVVDADLMLRFPEIGHTTRMQITDADILLLNKVDLVKETELKNIEKTLKKFNDAAPVVRVRYCKVDSDLLFGISREKQVTRVHHDHQKEYMSFSFESKERFDRRLFEKFADNLGPEVIRAKGFVRFWDSSFLFNYVSGRWDLEPFDYDETLLVFIGKQLEKEKILRSLQVCVAQSGGYEYLEELATADIAFRATGDTLEEVFRAAADATLNVMIEDLESVEKKEARECLLRNGELDLLLFDFLQEIIFFKDSEQLLLRAEKLEISEKGDEHLLHAILKGETLDPEKHAQRVDVKAVTLHRFELKRNERGWEATVILDI